MLVFVCKKIELDINKPDKDEVNQMCNLKSAVTPIENQMHKHVMYFLYYVEYETKCLRLLKNELTILYKSMHQE